MPTVFWEGYVMRNGPEPPAYDDWEYYSAHTLLKRALDPPWEPALRALNDIEKGLRDLSDDSLAERVAKLATALKKLEGEFVERRPAPD